MNVHSHDTERLVSMPNNSTSKLCPINDCGRKPRTRGMCNSHYTNELRRGRIRVLLKPSAEDRFWSKVDKTETCWLWALPVTGRYARFKLSGSDRQAHRVAYEWANGPVPDGLEIDHLCRVRHCVRPSHLEAVTHTENLRRGNGWSGRNVRKTHCPQEHPYSPGNTYTLKHGGRRCKTCAKLATRKYLRKKAAS